MRIFAKKGIVFRDKSDLFVDASGIREKSALITHAHSDHAKVSNSNTYFCTPETHSLISEGKKCAFEKVPFGKKFSIGEYDCKFHPSGHILGSAQVSVSNGVEAVLTSDFKLQDSILFKGAEILPSEMLVIETTFGSPEYSFPSREDVYEDLIAWAHHHLSNNHFLVLGGYSTGKAQELTKVVNEFLSEIPLVYNKIFEQNKRYEENGVKLGDYLELNHNLNDSNVLIVPPNLIDDHLLSALQHQLGKRVEAAIATGWRSSRYKTFPLSDHADFEGLLRYVRDSNPKLVLTTHGFEDEFARHVRRKLGISARPLSSAYQQTLGIV